MLSNLPVGVFQPGDSVVHRLRARTKLLVLIWLALAFFVANHKTFHFGTFAVGFAILITGLICAHVSFRYLWRRMRLLLVLLAIGVPFSLLWTPGRTWKTFGPAILTLRNVHVDVAGFHWHRALIQIPIGPAVITWDGLWFTFSATAIFVLLFLGSMALTLTTSPVAIAEGAMLLLRPARRLRLPVDEFGLMTLIALRFFPLLVREAEQLVKAQVSRGIDFHAGSFGTRLRAIGSLLVPLIQGALRRAAELAQALESRGYGVNSEATLLHEGRLRLADWIVLLLVPTATVLAYVMW